MVNVLCVEDNAFFRKCLLDMLVSYDHKVIGAGNGLEGLGVLASDVSIDKVDIIFLDYNMPVMNGYEFSLLVKTDSKYKKHSSTPIVGIGSFPEDMRTHLVECHEKFDLMLKDYLRFIDTYCK